ncbi:MAG: HNH endonuclease [Lachnospiraceae bacterium]|nr:HNH endonuclease [Lachnospiraceae bacterium]
MRNVFNPYNIMNRRPDRVGEQRTAFEKNRKIVLKTQTVCGICGQPVDFSYTYPHPLSPTVDHIIPVSKGGHPSALENLQLAHRWCNRQKSNKLFESRKISENDRKEINNRNLPQHFDWVNYRPNK